MLGGVSFLRFDAKPLLTREAIARRVHAVSLRRNLDELATAIALMTIDVEAGANDENGERQWWCPWNAKDPQTEQFPHDSESDDGLSSGYFQQQVSRPGAPGKPWGWGGLFGDLNGARKRMTLEDAADMFLAALPNNYRDAANNPVRAGQFAQQVQGSAHPERYATRWNDAWAVLRRALAEQPTPTEPEENTVAVKGDPIWLEAVLREALGDRLVVHAGWELRGAGGVMGEIWGTMIHHTGNVNERVEVIRDGVQQPSGWLPGPLSQCLITPDGKCHLIAIGPCNHAGGGEYGTLKNGNRDAIGFECAYSGSGQWPQKQIITMRDATAAISKKLGKRADESVCGHKEYAKPAGRKVDPGNMSMDWFRDEVQKDLDGFVFPGEPLTSTPPPPQTGPETPPADADNIAYFATAAYWEMLGWRTQTEALAVILDKLLGTQNAGKTGASLTRPAAPK